MFKPVKVLDIELQHPLKDLLGLNGYDTVHAIVRLRGKPLGYVNLPLTNGSCSVSIIYRTIVEQQGATLAKEALLTTLVTTHGDGRWHGPQSGPTQQDAQVPWPRVTVAVCTRDRPDSLADCLAALSRLDYPALDLLVVDNAPRSPATAHLLRHHFPHIRYAREPRPGLNWARNRAIAEAHGDILAYTDDDVTVDPHWVRALARVFAEHPDVMAVTGLVAPGELDTAAQHLFERYGGFGRGFKPCWYRVDRASGEKAATHHGGAGKFGTGANMAYRLSLFARIGGFDPALDVGTVTNGGGDLEMFFRVLKEGYTLVYEPAALVRHRHRRDYAQLREQIANFGVGFYAYLVRSALHYRDERWPLMRLGLWWLWRWNIRRLLISFRHPGRFPRDLILAELWGSLRGLGRYPKARRTAARMAQTDQTRLPCEAVEGPPVMAAQTRDPLAVAMRTIDVTRPLPTLDDVSTYSGIRLLVMRGNRPLGVVEIANRHQPVSPARLRQAIVAQLAHKLLHEGLAQSFAPPRDAASATGPAILPAHVSVSVVIATYDRPDDLRNCLHCLVSQASPRPVEIVVVDNHPGSGLTPAVVAEFPGVVLLSEPRQGLACARNSGIIVSHGDIVVATDDDVTMPPDWLEKLLSPFMRDEVMAVTGNILPSELDTGAQRLFEAYGGLGRGFEPVAVDGAWFRQFRSAVPTWTLGATANAAFRAEIFTHPGIGMLDEALGAGTHTGCSEDTYLFYKILKAGHTLVYEPSAFVFHRHRRDLTALRRQIYNYSKGHVAYQLTTLVRDRDPRAMVRLGIRLPQTYLRRVKERLLGRSEYPVSLILLEVAGNLAGPWSLWRSRRRVRRLGYRTGATPVTRRAETVLGSSAVQEPQSAAMEVR
jgi:GT2 family glycosyltransferase